MHVHLSILITRPRFVIDATRRLSSILCVLLKQDKRHRRQKASGSTHISRYKDLTQYTIDRNTRDDTNRHVVPYEPYITYEVTTQLLILHLQKTYSP